MRGNIINPIQTASHSAYYPFTYLVKWDTINKMKFGDTLRNKLDAVSIAIKREKDISLVEHKITTNFDCIYIAVQSGPNLSPSEVLKIVKNNVYCVISEKYPEYRKELLSDIWKLVSWNDKSDMNYVPYYIRFDVKYGKNLLNKMAGDKLISEIVKEGIRFAQQSYNMKHDDPIEVKTINFNSHSVELVVACPLNVNAATISQQFKGASSSFIGKNYEQYFKNENSPVFISKKSFWSRGKFYVLSSKPVKEITQREFHLYKKLKNMWDNIKTENNPNKKGKILEQFAENMFELMNDFEILRGENGNYDINLGFEQIDLTLKNKSDDLKRWGNFIKVECKNHAKPVGNDIIRDFSGKLRGNIRLGILISANGFGKFDEKLLVRLLANDKKLIVRISGHEIEDWLNKILTSFINIDEKKNNKLYNIEYMFQEKINRAELELI